MVNSNDVISAIDYNDIRGDTVTILQGSYGQTPVSQIVDGFNTFGISADKVTRAQLKDLFLDIQRVYVHQVGSLNSEVAVPLQGYKIGADGANTFDVVTGDSQPATDSTKMGLNDLIAVKNTIATFDQASGDSFATGSFSLGNTAISNRNTNWGGDGQVQSIYHIFEATFSSLAEMNQFFNAGGSIRFNAQIANGTTSKAAQWSGIFAAMGTVQFQKYNTVAASGTGSMGYTGLTNLYQQVFTKTGSGAYAVNDYTIDARVDINQLLIRFRVSINDDYVTDPLITNPDITVDGTITNTASVYYPDSVFEYDGQSYGVSITGPSMANDLLLSSNNPTPPT